MDTKALNNISYGLFILTAAENGKDNGCIINTVMQTANEPNQICISVNKANFTHDMIMRNGKFNISVIDRRADFELFKHFGFTSGRDTDKFAGFSDVERSGNGLLYITQATNAFFSVKVERSFDVGSHTMFNGQVVDMKVLGDSPSVTYEYYHSSIKPKAVGTTADGKTIWRCTICGYEFVGEELPEDFICPLCKHPASDFEKITVSESKVDAAPANKYAGTQTESHRDTGHNY